MDAFGCHWLAIGWSHSWGLAVGGGSSVSVSAAGDGCCFVRVLRLQDGSSMARMCGCGCCMHTLLVSDAMRLGRLFCAADGCIGRLCQRCLVACLRVGVDRSLIDVRTAWFWFRPPGGTLLPVRLHMHAAQLLSPGHAASLLSICICCFARLKSVVKSPSSTVIVPSLKRAKNAEHGNLCVLGATQDCTQSCAVVAGQCSKKS